MDYVDICIVGGGIVGLLIAKRLADRGISGVILESSIYLGDASTGRNSGVLHAGVYYPEGSLKHQTCVSGNQLWTTLSQELSIPIFRCGKFVIAERKVQEEKLTQIYMQAEKNKVPGISWMTKNQRVQLSDFVNVQSGFFSKSTAILDVPKAVKALRKYIECRGFLVLPNQKVESIQQSNEGFIITIDKERAGIKTLINAAGHGAVELRSYLGLMELKSRWIKGHYLRLKSPLKHPWLIYSAPDDSDRGLGIHNVIGMDGSLSFGPDSQDITDFNYKLSEDRIKYMKADVSSRFKGISQEQLVPDYCGIRSKILYNDRPYHDFWLKGPEYHKIPRYIELCGIDSPGLTAAPALAEKVSSLIDF